jgi:hypothetical protein
VRLVADGDDEVAVLLDVFDARGSQPAQRQAVALRGGDRTRVDRARRVGAG